MKKHPVARAGLVSLLAICLSLPSTALGAGKSGKKYFKEGVKYENTEQWDLAAQQFALAMGEDPSNAEYRLRWLRAMQMSSLMYSARGDLLEAKGDYAGAYNAYAKALASDPSNETNRAKMTRMLEQQRAQAGNGEPVTYNQHTGNLVQTSNQIQTVRPKPRGDALQKIEFSQGASLKVIINSLARELNLNVVYDESVKDAGKVSISLNEVTPARALDIILLQNKLIFEQVDRRTIMIYADNPANRQRMEKLLVKTFYLTNADLNETRNLVLSNLGVPRQVNISKQLNALVVRATASELAVAKAIIDSVDKRRAEVVLDVNIYDVLNTGTLQIGNSLFTGSSSSASDPTKGAFGLDNLGGFGFEKFRNGALFGLPASSLSLLQSKGNSKLLASTQIHALDGEQNQTTVGRSVPVKTGTTYVSGTSSSSSNTIDNIQYRDVGLVIDVTPTIATDGYVQIKMKLESSNVETSAEVSDLTPSFNKRSLTTISRMQDGVTAVVACIKQDSKGDNRTTVPVIGMVPILGRLFSAPTQTSSRTDIVITVTPHITRATEISPEDHLAYSSGTPQAGLMQSVEEVIQRAQDEDEQERRAIAEQSPNSPDRTVPAAASMGAPSADQSAKILKVTTPSTEPVQTAPAEPVQSTPAPSVAASTPPFANWVNPSTFKKDQPASGAKPLPITKTANQE